MRYGVAQRRRTSINTGMPNQQIHRISAPSASRSRSGSSDGHRLSSPYFRRSSVMLFVGLGRAMTINDSQLKAHVERVQWT